MDWSRAKTVLIIAFLMLNALLGYQLWIDELNLDLFADTASKREETLRLLQAQGIVVRTEIPETTPVLNEITVQYDEAYSFSEPKPVPKPFPVSVLQNESQLSETLRPFVKQMDLYDADPNAAYAGKDRFILYQLHNGLPMFEVRIELFAQEDQVVAYRQTLAKVQPSSDLPSGSTEVLSAFTALNSLAENYLPEGAVIAAVQLGYHGPIFESETQVLAPYWRILLESGETYYVHALNGAVESPIEPNSASGKNKTGLN